MPQNIQAFITSDRVAQYTGGYWLNLETSLRFSGVSYAQYIKGNLYFPVNPKQINMDSINKYIAAGISAIVLENEDLVDQIRIPVLIVKKIGIAFAQTAKAVRQAVNPKTVLITGTEGKTGTKLQLGLLLSQLAKVHYIPNSQNNLHSVYRTLADLREDDEVELTEVGCGGNTRLNQTRGLAVNPDMVFYTQIGLAHMDFHHTLDGLLRNKASVLAGLREKGLCLVNTTIDCLDAFITQIRAQRADARILTYGERQEDNARVVEKSLDMEQLGWQVKAEIDGEPIAFFHPLFHQFVPVMSCGILLAIKRLGYDIQQAAPVFRQFKPYETMGQLLQLKKNGASFLFYNQSRRGGGINSIVSSFIDLNNFRVKGKIIALLGSMSIKEDEENTLMLHRETAYEVNRSQISRLYTTGIHMQITREYLDKPEIFVKHSDDYQELLQDLLDELQEGDLLFIKGHASLNLTRLAKMLLNHPDITHKYRIIKGVITL